MGRTQQEKDYRSHFRQKKILEILSTPGGATSSRLVETLHSSRSQIMRDIRDLRMNGYPIQVSSMKTEGGMYAAVFELPERYWTSSQSNTPAPGAAPH